MQIWFGPQWTSGQPEQMQSSVLGPYAILSHHCLLMSINFQQFTPSSDSLLYLFSGHTDKELILLSVLHFHRDALYVSVCLPV